MKARKRLAWRRARSAKAGCVADEGFKPGQELPKIALSRRSDVLGE